MKKNSQLSIHDMVGNVSEWTYSIIESSFVRGETFINRSGISWSTNEAMEPNSNAMYIGFRVVRNIP